MFDSQNWFVKLTPSREACQGTVATRGRQGPGTGTSVTARGTSCSSRTGEWPGLESMGEVIRLRPEGLEGLEQVPNPRLIICAISFIKIIPLFVSWACNFNTLLFTKIANFAQNFFLNHLNSYYNMAPVFYYIQLECMFKHKLIKGVIWLYKFHLFECDQT
jgi:hypothetical protein